MTAGRSARWDAFAARVGSDWVAATEHRRWLEDADFWGYSGRLHKRTETPAPAAAPTCDFADEPPLSPEEEEALAALAAAPAQMELF